MSGGKFDYMQYQFDSVASEILEIIRDNEKGWDGYNHDQWGRGQTYESFGYNKDGKEITVKPEGWTRYSQETIRLFQDAYIKCKEAGVYAQRVDWLVSGDDGEDTFHHRLAEDLEKLYVEIQELGAKNWYIGKSREREEIH
jgi:hypothetical protein